MSHNLEEGYNANKTKIKISRKVVFYKDKQRNFMFFSYRTFEGNMCVHEKLKEISIIT